MNKLIIACLLSAGLGGVLGAWTVLDGRGRLAYGQEGREGIRRPQTGAINDIGADPRWGFGRPGGLEPLAAELAEYGPEERANILVYEKVNRSVVHIRTKVPSADVFFSLEGPSEGTGAGSVLDRNGHILTNYHVIEGASELHVALHNGEEYPATLVGRDALSDIAVLRISAPPESLFPIELGDSRQLRVGQKVLAIGNPFGLERTLTVGTLSSLNRSIPTRERQLKSMIQIDAALNRGNSGGPLLNSQGRMIGMNTAILSPTGQNIGVGFALPVNSVKRVVPQLIEKGRVTRPVTGILSVYANELGLVIVELSPGGPAERAGLRGFRIITRREKRGLLTFESRQIDRAYADTIIAVDGQPVTTGDVLQDVIDSKQPGDSIVVRVIRNGQPLDVTVVLGASN
jgi:S1-C subfamily serine protease